jgi:hypothetical protein
MTLRNRITQLRSGGLPVKGVVLVLAVLVIYGAVGPVAWSLSGSPGLAAAGLAAGVCLGGAAAALAISYIFRAPQHVLYGVLFGMAARMGLPLAAGLICWRHGGPLAEAGALYYLLIFYPITLGVETVLSLPVAARGASQAMDK